MSVWSKITSIFSGKTARERFIESQEASEKPWAAFEVDGFEDDGRVKIMFNWNKPFFEKIKEMGFQAETEEDSVQLFFYASSLRPMSMATGDEAVQPDGMPNLTSNQNVLKT